MAQFPKPCTDAGISRRGFLRSAGALCLLPLAGVALPARASLEASAGRRLSFAHTHTGEHLSLCYFENGSYLPESLTRVQHLFRDFRSGEAHRIDPGLLDILYELQRLTDREGSYEIISAYRSPATNASLRRRSAGVAEHSLHLQGQAIDVRLPGFSTSRLADLARGLQRGGVGYYASSDFVHVDTGRVRYW
jgi:uncharacterized protein YcbK (DUF882 family)